jgi:sugar lactone lactonase YvrE
MIDRCGIPINVVQLDDEGCADSKDAPILEIGPDGKTIRAIGVGEIVSAHAIAVDRDGNIWVADFQSNKAGNKGMQVVKLSPDGTVLLRLGKPGQPGLSDEEFNQPTGLAVLSNGDIVISEGHGSKLNKSRINIYTQDGKFLRSFGTHGTGAGQLTEPHAVAVDSQDRIYVADRMGSRVNVYDRDGTFRASWKQFGRPSGVWVDKDDMLYVSDSQSNEMNNPGCKAGIRVGSVKDGKVIIYIPPPPGVDDRNPPPEGITVDSHGTIYAAAVQMKDIKKYTK